MTTTTTTRRTLKTVTLSYYRSYWENGQRYSDGFNISISKGMISRSVSGSLTYMLYENVPAWEVLDTARRSRAEALKGIGQVTITLLWERDHQEQRECAYRQGVYRSSISQQEYEAKNPPTNDRRSYVVDALVEYLTTGDEVALSLLHDYLTDVMNLPDVEDDRRYGLRDQLAR